MIIYTFVVIEIRTKQYMKITVKNGNETIIGLSGQLDTLTSADFEKEIT